MAYNQMKDNELVQLLANRNSEEAFCELYTRYCRRLQMFSLTFIKIHKEAEDVVQEVFTSVWSNRQSLDSDKCFSSYIYTITRNRILNFLRHTQYDTRVKEQLQNAGHPATNTVEVQLLDNEYTTLLDNAITHLPPLRQIIFRLSRKESKSHKEIAQLLNISPYTVQENISAALKYIKTYITCHTGLHIGI